MFPHTVDVGELLTGKRQSGGCSAIMTFARKSSSALVIFVFSFVLELSATALISAGWLHGIRRGYLDEKFLAPAIKAFEACVAAMEESEEGIYMTEISGPTIPLPLLPKLGYKMIPLGKNWSYGVAALIFASIEYKRRGSTLIN